VTSAHALINVLLLINSTIGGSLDLLILYNVLKKRGEAGNDNFSLSFFLSQMTSHIGSYQYRKYIYI